MSNCEFLDTPCSICYVTQVITKRKVYIGALTLKNVRAIPSMKRGLKVNSAVVSFSA